MIKFRLNKSFQQKMLNPVLFKIFLLFKLPMAFLAGLKMNKLTAKDAVVSMKYKYLNKNPFGSIYFACLLMGGELASGILAASIVYKSNPKISMLVVGVKSRFIKKALGKIIFECNQGEQILETIQKSLLTGESQTIDVLTVASDKEGDVVAEFIVNWSFKSKG